MITNEDITNNFALIDGQVYRIGSQRPETGKRVVVYKGGLSYNVATQAVHDVLARFEKCPGACEDGKVWANMGYTPCQHCGREDEMKMPSTYRDRHVTPKKRKKK
jgi:phage terminase large subunit GpA-like protein